MNCNSASKMNQYYALDLGMNQGDPSSPRAAPAP